MYLLQSTEFEPLFYLFAALVSLGIMYLVIRAAVKDGSADLRTLIRFQNNLLIRDLQDKGMSSEEITNAMSDALKGKTTDPKRRKEVA